MHETTSAPVAVAVPHDGVESALRFAAHEALVRGCPALVVGAEETSSLGTPPEVLRRAAASVEVLAGPGVPADVRVVPDGEVETVLADSREASLVVVHRSNVLHLLHALSYGAIGAQALTDVACIPSDWRPRRDDARPVVVAVDDAFHARSLLAAGLEHALIHGAPLHVVHAWELPCRLGPEKDAAIATLWSAELEQRLRRQAADLADLLPCTVDVRRGVPSEAVIAAAVGAQLLVLGRNAAATDHLCHVGRTARTALRESPCPVVLLARAGVRASRA